MRQRFNLNRHWNYAASGERREDAGRSLRYEEVDIPHSMSETALNYIDEASYQKWGYYRRSLAVPPAWEGKRIFLHCEAVAHAAEVYLNGEKIGEHACGYTAFAVELSSHLRYGAENELLLLVDAHENLEQPPFGGVIDYLTYGGIYREVYLELRESAFLKEIYPRAIVDDCGTGLCRLRSSFSMEGEEPGDAICQRLRPLHRENGVSLGKMEVKKREESYLYQVADLHCELWSPEHPHLYELTTTLLRGEEVLDEQVHVVGFRRAEFRAEGFYLNGEKYKIRGLNRHQSYPYVGYAMPASLQEMDARVLKEELALNAVRTSHYPQSHDFLSACDRLGLLVFTEIPGWQHISSKPAWRDRHLRNVGEMVCQYRHHPSIILWGTRINESPDDEALYRAAAETARRFDDRRAIGGVRCFPKSQLLEDVYTYNDFLHDGYKAGCAPKRKITSDPQKAYLVTEYNGHMCPTKNFDHELRRCEQALRHARVLDAIAGQDEIAGSFGWCMADYNTHQDFGSGDHICYHGVLDSFRNPKLAAAVYRMQGEAPMLALSSSLDIGEHDAGMLQKIYLFSNADEVRMYKNDRYIATYPTRSPDFPHLPHAPVRVDNFVIDDLAQEEGLSPYEARQLRYLLNHVADFQNGRYHPRLLWAAAYLVLGKRYSIEYISSLYTKYVGNWGSHSPHFRFDAYRNGERVASREIRPARAVQLRVKASASSLKEGKTYDALALRVEAISPEGQLLPYWQEPLHCELEGPARLIGPDWVSAKGGQTGFYLRSVGEAGLVRLRITSPALPPSAAIEREIPVSCEPGEEFQAGLE